MGTRLKFAKSKTGFTQARKFGTVTILLTSRHVKIRFEKAKAIEDIFYRLYFNILYTNDTLFKFPIDMLT